MRHIQQSQHLSVLQERIYKLEDQGWDPTDFHKSLEKSFEWGDKIPAGLLYKTEQPTYEDSEPIYEKGALVKQKVGLSPEVFKEIIEELI